MTIVEMPPFTKWVKKNGLASSVAKLVADIAANPEIGDVIPGGSGLRKIRMAVPGRGKRGGARVVYIAVIRHNVAGLITGYMKNEQEDLSDAQLAKAKKMAAEIEAAAPHYKSPKEPDDGNPEEQGEA